MTFRTITIIFLLMLFEPCFADTTSKEADSDGNGLVNARDALIIINHLNQTDAPYRKDYDINKDGMVTSVDALRVINYINKQAILKKTKHIKPMTAVPDGKDDNEEEIRLMESLRKIKTVTVSADSSINPSLVSSCQQEASDRGVSLASFMQRSISSHLGPNKTMFYIPATDSFFSAIEGLSGSSCGFGTAGPPRLPSITNTCLTLQSQENRCKLIKQGSYSWVDINFNSGTTRLLPSPISQIIAVEPNALDFLHARPYILSLNDSLAVVVSQHVFYLDPSSLKWERIKLPFKIDVLRSKTRIFGVGKNLVVLDLATGTSKVIAVEGASATLVANLARLSTGPQLREVAASVNGVDSVALFFSKKSLYYFDPVKLEWVSLPNVLKWMMPDMKPESLNIGMPEAITVDGNLTSLAGYRYAGPANDQQQASVMRMDSNGSVDFVVTLPNGRFDYVGSNFLYRNLLNGELNYIDSATGNIRALGRSNSTMFGSINGKDKFYIYDITYGYDQALKASVLGPDYKTFRSVQK